MQHTPTLLQSDTLFGTCALALLVDEFGSDVLSWDPASVEIEIRRTWGIEASPEVLDRVNAASSLFTSNLFFLSLEAFSVMCNSLNFGVTTSATLIPPDLDDVLWGVTEAAILLGDTFNETPFSHNIALYVGYLLKQAGVAKPPSILDFAEYPPDGASPEEMFTDMSPEEYHLYWDEQEADRVSLESENNAKVITLFQQLSALPLQSASKEFVAQMKANLQNRLTL